MGGTRGRSSDERRDWRALFAVRSLVDESSLDDGLFAIRYVAVVALAVGLVVASDADPRLAILLLVGGLSVTRLLHLQMRRTGQPPRWMPPVDLLMCLAFAATTTDLYVPAAFVAIAPVTMAAMLYGPGWSVLTVVSGTVGLMLVARHHDLEAGSTPSSCARRSAP